MMKDKQLDEYPEGLQFAGRHIVKFVNQYGSGLAVTQPTMIDQIKSVLSDLGVDSKKGENTYYLYVKMLMYIYTYLHIRLHRCKHVKQFIYIYIYMLMNKKVYIYIYTDAYIIIYIYIYVYLFIYIYRYLPEIFLLPPCMT
jgi:hypothetical protein